MLPSARNCSGIGAHTNIPARGFGTSQPVRFRPSTSASRRFSYSATTAATAGSACRRAMIAAICTAWKMP